MSYWNDQNATQPLQDQERFSVPTAFGAHAPPNDRSHLEILSNSVCLEQMLGTPPEASTKRLACDVCRERKVKCGREQPTCGRCAKMGHKCNYSGSFKQTITKTDLTRLLLTLHDRLDQTKALLNLNAGPQTNSIQNMDPTWDTEISSLISSAKTSYSNTLGYPSPLHTFPGQVNDLQLNSSQMPAHSSASGAGDWSTADVTSGSDTTIFDIQPSDPSSIPPPPGGSPFDESTLRGFLTPSAQPNSESRVGSNYEGQFSTLHANYFEVLGPVVPMVNPSRFSAELSQQPDSIHIQALSRVIETLGALISQDEESALLEESLYNQARNLLDICERQETSEAFCHVNALQACVLLVLYELHKPNIARAWMTMGRAHRLCRIMGLESLSIATPHRTAVDSRSPNSPPSISDPGEIEERRRTFWQLYIIDTIIGMKSGWITAFNEANVPFPTCEDETDSSELAGMATLGKVFEMGQDVPLNDFSGIIVVTCLYRRCSDHIQDSLQRPSYPFWDGHYRIDKLITQCRKRVLAKNLNLSLKTSHTPLSLILSINLAAVEIILNEAAIARANKDHLPAAIAKQATAACMSASNSVVEAIWTGRQLIGNDYNAFRRSAVALSWAMTVTIQTHLSMLAHGGSSLSTHLNSLRVLATAMKDLVDPGQVSDGLLKRIDAALSGFEKSSKRSHSQIYID